MYAYTVYEAVLAVAYRDSGCACHLPRAYHGSTYHGHTSHGSTYHIWQDLVGQWEIEQLSEITGDSSTSGTIQCRLSIVTCKAAFMDSQVAPPFPSDLPPFLTAYLTPSSTFTSLTCRLPSHLPPALVPPTLRPAYLPHLPHLPSQTLSHLVSPCPPPPTYPHLRSRTSALLLTLRASRITAGRAGGRGAGYRAIRERPARL